MIRTRQTCYSTNDKALYPFDEVVMFWSEGATTDDGEILTRKLLPVTSLEAMLNRKEIFLHSIEFAGYDTSDSLLETGEDEDKEFANEIVFGNMLSASWQPNYCRPIVRINGVNYTSGISSFGNANADFNKSIGLPLPFCLTINKVIKEPREIELYGALAQKTNAGYRNYPMLAIINYYYYKYL